jgi:hypothetical protein
MVAADADMNVIGMSAATIMTASRKLRILDLIFMFDTPFLVVAGKKLPH